MLRLVLGLVVVLVLTLAVWRSYFGEPSPERVERAAREGVTLPRGKNAQEMADKIRKDLKRVEDQNRAAMDRAIRSETP